MPDNANVEVPRGSSTDAEVARHEHLALVSAALAALATILWLMSPVAVGMLFGGLLAFTFRPTYERIARHWTPPAAALATVLGSTLVVALTFGGLVWILVHGATVLSGKVVNPFGPGGAEQKAVSVIDEVTSRIGISIDDLHAKVRTMAGSAVTRAESIAQTVTSTTASTALGVFFGMLTMYFVLRHWKPIAAAAEDLLPLRPEYTRKLLVEFRRVGRATLLSTVGIGLLQGALATVGYRIVGLPQPLFFGALTALVSVVPGLGTMLVWVPAAVILIVSGRLGAGIFLAAWGVVVLTAIPTYVINPRLVGRGSNVPALFMFIALFGGTAVFGLKGLILGPVLMTVGIATLRIYADEERARKHVTSP